jgi:hypothetical protein
MAYHHHGVPLMGGNETGERCFDTLKDLHQGLSVWWGNMERVCLPGRQCYRIMLLNLSPR